MGYLRQQWNLYGFDNGYDSYKFMRQWIFRHLYDHIFNMYGDNQQLE